MLTPQDYSTKKCAKCKRAGLSHSLSTHNVTNPYAAQEWKEVQRRQLANLPYDDVPTRQKKIEQVLTLDCKKCGPVFEQQKEFHIKDKSEVSAQSLDSNLVEVKSEIIRDKTIDA